MKPQKGPKLLDKDTARNRILAAGKDGRVFGVTFVKRKDGTIRKMRCRFGVTKGVKGILPEGYRKLEDDIVGTVTVYEMGVGFKRIPLDSVIEVHGKGV